MSEQANPVTTHPAIVGEVGEQIGMKHLKFRCPQCGAALALDGPGHWSCHCGASVEVKAPEGF